VFGHGPARPAKLNYEVASVDTKALGGKAVRKIVAVFFGEKPGDPKMNLLVYLPAAAKKPIPVFLGLSFAGIWTVASDPGVPLFDFQRPLDRGLLVTADTVEKLAERCGLDAAALRNTIDRYNEGVDRGEDRDFGRDGLCAHAGALVRLDRAPYYAYPSTTVVLATYCGLHADAKTRVRDVDGNIIDGLFAAGEVVGGFHGQSYMTGTSLGKGAVFGRIAGQQAAARALGATDYDRRE